MKRWMGIFLLIFFSFIESSCSKEKGDIGMWVWSSRNYTTSEERENLLEFSSRYGINLLDVHVNLVFGREGYKLRDEQAVRELVIDAAKAGIKVNLLRGEKHMFFTENQKRTLEELKGMIAFNEGLPEEAKLLGIKYDVEPYTTERWRGTKEDREGAMREYLEYLEKAGGILKESNSKLLLSVDIPFWYDIEDLILEYRGERRRFNEYIQDRTDYVTLMSYRRDPKEVYSLVRDEIKYAQKIGRSVYAGLIADSDTNPKTTFSGYPQEEFWGALKELDERASKTKAFDGIMLHHYRSLEKYFEEY